MYDYYGEPQLVNRGALFQAYAEWAKRIRWDVFVTLTFSSHYCYSYNSAKGKFRQFVRAIENYEGKRGQTSWFVSMESKPGEGFHIHGVGKNVRDILFARHWWKKHYGKCTVRAFDPEQHAIEYITKVINQNGTPEVWGPAWGLLKSA